VKVVAFGYCCTFFVCWRWLARCGQHITLPLSGGGDISDNTRELRQYLHPLVAILLPAGQAAVSALAGGVTVSSIAWAMDAHNPIAAGGVAAGITFGVSWLVALSWWRARVEGAAPAHLSGEAQPEQVIYPAETIRVELQTPNGGFEWVDYLDIPFERELIFRAAAELYRRGYDTSGLGGAGKVLTRSQGESFRDWLISKELGGWYREDHHSLGWFVSGVGRSVIRRLYHAGVSTGELDLIPPPKRSIVTEQAIYERLQARTSTQEGVSVHPEDGLSFPSGLVRVDHDDRDGILAELWS